MQLLLKIDIIVVLNLGQTVGELELDTDEPPNFKQRLPMSHSAQNPPLSYRVSPKSLTLIRGLSVFFMLWSGDWG